MFPSELKDFLERIDGILPADRVTLKVTDMVVRGEHDTYRVVRLCSTRQNGILMLI